VQDHKRKTAMDLAAGFDDVQRYLTQYSWGFEGPVIAVKGHSNPLRMCK
jgi:hypothetical protein